MVVSAEVVVGAALVRHPVNLVVADVAVLLEAEAVTGGLRSGVEVDSEVIFVAVVVISVVDVVGDEVIFEGVVVEDAAISGVVVVSMVIVAAAGGVVSEAVVVGR